MSSSITSVSMGRRQIVVLKPGSPSHTKPGRQSALLLQAKVLSVMCKFSWQLPSATLKPNKHSDHN